jgi:hypothetical protein
MPTAKSQFKTVFAVHKGMPSDALRALRKVSAAKKKKKEKKLAGGCPGSVAPA